MQPAPGALLDKFEADCDEERDSYPFVHVLVSPSCTFVSFVVNAVDLLSFDGLDAGEHVFGADFLRIHLLDRFGELE